MPTEAGYDREVARWAQKEGWLSRKLQYSGRRGALDRMFIRKGVVVFVEMKQESGGLRREQATEMEALRAHGANVRVCYSANEAKNVLRSYFL